MYTIQEFDKQKTKVFKYITFKKRTEREVRIKFQKEIEEEMLEDIIEYLKEAGYINDYNYVERQTHEYMALKNMSIKEIQYKLYQKGIDKNTIEEYISKNKEELEEYERQSLERIKIKKANQMSEEEIKTYLYKKGYNSEI
ncbi:MAG: RecX family transcriptional regulator [Clostridia bacterium]|nr:RecX family transcriptional regulator [Clostridia bacterium]